MKKVAWSGRVVSVQPRIRLGRSFDERYHTYLGFCLVLEGKVGGESRQFSVGLGKVTQEKYEFRVGDEVRGTSVPVADPRKEPVELYRASKLQVGERGAMKAESPPPWHGVPPDLETYRERGHRRLSARTYQAKCTTCIWGCRMPVEMIIDPWDPQKRYRFETFCYGPKSCPNYKPGPRRVVPGRKGMRWEEPDWVDEQDTAHRGMDE
ncbi:MAG: hypothetical protein ACOC7N_04660 [Chloroflexota bacterium]